jgi:hypothetical protein
VLLNFLNLFGWAIYITPMAKVFLVDSSLDYDRPILLIITILTPSLKINQVKYLMYPVLVLKYFYIVYISEFLEDVRRIHYFCMCRNVASTALIL